MTVRVGHAPPHPPPCGSAGREPYLQATASGGGTSLPSRLPVAFGMFSPWGHASADAGRRARAIGTVLPRMRVGARSSFGGRARTNLAQLRWLRCIPRRRDGLRSPRRLPKRETKDVTKRRAQPGGARARPRRQDADRVRALACRLSTYHRRVYRRPKFSDQGSSSGSRGRRAKGVSARGRSRRRGGTRMEQKRRRVGRRG